MPITGAAFTVHPVSDVRVALRFYRDVLGLALNREVGIPDQYAELLAGDHAVGLAGPALTASAPGSARSLGLEVDDLHAFVRDLGQRGATPPAIEETPVCWLAQLQDPDGNLVTLHQRKG